MVTIVHRGLIDEGKEFIYYLIGISVITDTEALHDTVSRLATVPIQVPSSSTVVLTFSGSADIYVAKALWLGEDRELSFILAGVPLLITRLNSVNIFDRERQR